VDTFCPRRTSSASFARQGTGGAAGTASEVGQNDFPGGC
jgi:hypothetical protein